MRPVKVPKLWAKLRKEDKRGRQEQKRRRRDEGQGEAGEGEGGKTSVVDEATRRLFATPFLQAQIYTTYKKSVVNDKVTQRLLPNPFEIYAPPPPQKKKKKKEKKQKIL